MKYRLLRFSLLSMLVMLFGGVSSVWADDTPGTIKFGNNAVKINKESVTGDDNLGNTWTITTVGTDSYTANASYYQVGSSSKPATSITFSTTLSKDVNITSFSAKFGGFGSTAGDISLKVDETEVGSGKLDGTNDVTIESTKSETGKVLTVSVTDIKKGVKCYEISYTYNDQTDQRVKTSLVFADGYATEGMEGTTIALPTATVKDASGNTIDGAAITWSSSNEEVATINGNEINLLTQGTSVIKATYAGDETAYRGSENSYTLNVTETDQIANPYKYEFTSKIFDTDELTKKLKNVTWTVETDGGYFDIDKNTNKGQQFGSGKNPAKYLKVKLSDIPGTITSVKINTSGAKDTNASFSIKVGDSDFKYGEATTATLTSDAAYYTFAGSASGDIVISYTQTSSTAIYIKSVEIEYKEEITPAEFRNFEAIVNNQTGTLLTSDEQVQGTAVEFGVAVAEDGTVSRVATDDASSIATISGTYHSDHGLTGMKVVTAVPGPVTIQIGKCTYSGNTIKVTNSAGQEVISYTPQGEQGSGDRVCWKNDRSNVIELTYTGEATTLTISGMGYCPYIAVKKYVAPAEFRNFEAIVNNQTGTLLTSDEQVQGTAVAFGVAVAEDGTVSRVATDDASSIATISGTYHSDHGLTGMKVVTAVPGPVTIQIGKCTYSGNTIKVTNSAGQEVISYTPQGEQGSGDRVCWKNDRSNVIELTYTGEATTLTITGMGYCPYIAVKEYVAPAEFRDFEAIVNNQTGTLLTAEEQVQGTAVAFGVAVAEDGIVSRVASDNASSIATISGIYHSEHGLTGMKVVTAVPGPVTIQIGKCTYSANTIKVTNSDGQEVISYTPQGEQGSGDRVCWKNDKTNVIELNYTGEATTLTITGMGYCPYVAVKKSNATSVDVAYSLGEVECEGDVLPAGGTYAAGDEYTIPANNFTLYKEGYTLTGWNDGKNTYGVGSKITLSESITLTPVFTQNEVSLADRTEPVTVKWNFRRDQGAPILNYQNKDGILVAQATIGNSTIDVKMPFTTNNGGKLNNQNNNDCAQCNNNTTFAIPSCKNAVVSMESYGGDYIFKAEGKTATTIDGQNDYEGGQNISYTIGNTAETIDIVMGNDAGYIRTIQVVLPVVQSAGGETFDNDDVLVEWPMLVDGNVDLNAYTATPTTAVSLASFDYTPSSATVSTGSRSKDPNNGLQFVTFTGENVVGHWFVKPVKGLTFTPTQIKLYVQRFGTNKKDGVVVTAKVGDEGAIQTLGTYTARRANWDDDQEEGQWGEKLSNLVNEVVIDLTEAQQTALASGEGFHLYATTGLSNKAAGFNDCRIYGKVNGTIVAVDMFTLAAAASPEEGGSVSKYPNADEYEAGTEVTMTATENFGYDFVNWTNAAGEEVSTDAKFKYTVKSNETLTANFVAVETYELALTVDGTNDYMVTVSPAPEVVDGKWMYEAGTTVELTANQYEGLVTFTNWSDGETNSKKLISMTANTNITAVYAEADIIAGWDFYKAGNNGRKADFYAQDNDADALNLVNTETGETSGWLDKSTLGGGGYEGFKGAAVNWRQGTKNGDVGNYHWQTKVNAEAFTDINVQFQMLYNYNAYQTYDAEYSLDGENWTKFGSITMTGNKQEASFSEKLPAECNNKAELYIRMKADKTSNVDGAASANDGNTLAMFFITGTPKMEDDGTAPVLVSTVPANDATGVSASGKIVLTFDERVKVAEGTVAYINNQVIKSFTQNPTKPTVSGKVVTFEYKGLEYGTKYNFVLAGKTIGDLTDNMIQDAIEISFTTMERPTVDKKLYDAVVENVDQLMAAITKAQNRSDKNVRYRIFIKNGEYTIPLSSTTKTCNGYDVPECITFINTSNLSIIGESRDDVIITNGIDKNETFAGTYGTTSKYDGIGNSDVFQLSGSDYYFQDLTVESGMDDGTGRDLAIQDKATRTIYKNTGLRGYQDTWTSNNDYGLYYFEDGYVRGRTDYMCGKGDAFFNGVELRQIYGGYAAVPSKSIKYGFTYKDCIINGEESPAVSGKKSADVDGNYTLGRPWGSGTPVALFIDTKMNVVPSAIGWNEMSGGWPKRFAEYNSTTSTGSVIDLSGRKTWWHEGGKEENPTIGEKNNPILTAEEALEAGNLHNMFGEWDPTLATEQAPIVQDVKLTGNKLSWTGSNYALLYAIVKDGKVIDFTTETSYDISIAATSRRAGETAKYQIRAANEMGGLNEASEVATATDGIETVNDNVNVNLNDNIYNLQGVRVNKAQKGVYIINGRKVVVK